MYFMTGEPLRRLDAFDRVFHRVFGPLAPEYEALCDNEDNEEWMPAADLVTDKEGYLLRLDLPGIAPEDIDIDLEENVLSVRGTRKKESEQENGKVTTRRETLRGRFWRSFRLPSDADCSSIKASHKNGVLEVRVPRQELVKPKRIPIAHA